MIKFVMCLRRRPEITREQFQDYLTKKHGPFFYEKCCHDEGNKICAISYH